MSQIKYFLFATQFKKNYSLFLKYSRQDKNLGLLSVLTITIVVITNTLMIWLMGNAINQIQLQHYEALPKCLIIFGVVVFINQAMQFIGSWIINEMCLRFIGRCRNSLLTQNIKVSFPIMSKFSKGDLLARLSNDIDIISQVVITGRIMLVSHVLTLTIYVAMLFWINSFLALAAITTIPLYFFHQRYFSSRKQQATQLFLENNAHLLAYEEQSLTCLRGISSNVAESRVSSNHYAIFKKAKIYAMKERLLLSGFSISFMLINYLVGLVIILLGVVSIQGGNLSVGYLLSFILYLGYLTIPVRGITDIILQCAGNTAAANRVAEILFIESNIRIDPNATELQNCNGNIDFINVTFSYSDDTTLFSNINLHLEGSKSYALVGPSGVGKSSLINLLMRFYDPQQGMIKIDGIDIQKLTLDSLRANIAVVWQDNFYINGSIKENLLMANSKATTEQIINACVAANAWQFIDELTDGLDTILGSNGISLSGGQYQRIAIAQAFLKNAAIIVFDEASSALDSESEQRIMSEMEKTFSERTLLIIAHRYSSIKNANQVIYFCADGQVIIGNHHELYEQLDDYREAVIWQTSLTMA